jgi:hypothetical protein
MPLRSNKMVEAVLDKPGRWRSCPTRVSDKQIATVQDARACKDGADDHDSATRRILAQPASERLVRTSASGHRLFLD